MQYLFLLLIFFKYNDEVKDSNRLVDITKYEKPYNNGILLVTIGLFILIFISSLTRILHKSK